MTLKRNTHKLLHVLTRQAKHGTTFAGKSGRKTLALYRREERKRVGSKKYRQILTNYYD